MINISAYVYQIKYRNQFNKDFNLITGASFDGGIDSVDTGLTMSPTYTEKFDGTRADYGAKYGQTLTATFTFIKEDYTDISLPEQRAILKWIGGYKQNSWITLYNHEFTEICQMYGRFINVQAKVADARVIGYIGEFETTSPFCYSPIREVEQIFTGQQTLLLNNDSDVEDDYVFPIITIAPVNGPISEIHLTNENINKTTIFKNIKEDELVTIDSANKIVTSNHEYRHIGNDFTGLHGEYVSDYPVWPKLESGINKFIIDPSGAVKVAFQYRCPMKIGTVINGVI